MPTQKNLSTMTAMKTIVKLSVLLIIIAALAFAAMRVVQGKTVEVAHAKCGSAVVAVYATGSVEATVMLPIAPRISAHLAELKVDEGYNVTKGQTLARFEDNDLRSGVEQFKAQEELARITLGRKAQLVKSGAGTKADYDSAKAQWDLAKAQTERANSEQDFSKLVAPADGLIIKRDGEIGQLIPSNQPVFWMSCCAPLRVSAEVNEEDIALVKPLQEVLIRADAFPDQIFHGKVQAITPKGDPIARTYRVRVEFTEDTPLQIGMTAETNIMISKKDDALLVPTSAIINNAVWVVRDGKLALQKVKQGAKGTTDIEIIEGIKDGESIVLSPTPELKEGEKVRAKISEPHA
jgi:multidrug efflux system membrane fusion protein